MILTERDHWLIGRQCEIQGDDSPESILNFKTAYMVAREFAWLRSRSSVSVEEIELLVRFLLCTGKPETRGRWREVEVVFASGDKALEPTLIAQAMDKWFVAFLEGEITPLELYKSLEEIHPGVDGNGRLGHLMWAIATTWETGEWPQELPPDVFQESYTHSSQERASYESFWEEAKI